MAKIEAVLFDFDGTLVDSLNALRLAYRGFLTQHNVAGSEAEFSELNGPSLREVVSILRERHCLKPALEELHECYWKNVREQYGKVLPFEGASELLTFVRSVSVRTALVTSSPRTLIQEFLVAQDWVTKFDVIVTGDEVAQAKPNPEIYEIALKRLDIDAARAVAIEDSANGVKAAKTAGVTVFRIGESGVMNLTEAKKRLGEIL